MLKIKEYVKAESLEQAYELNQKKTNCVIGGMLWLKMVTRNVQKAIDLSGLGLDQIEENDEEFSIGAMVTLRQIELHEGLNTWSQGTALRQCVSHFLLLLPDSMYFILHEVQSVLLLPLLRLNITPPFLRSDQVQDPTDQLLFVHFLFPS